MYVKKKNKFLWVAIYIQRLLLYFFYSIFRLTKKKRFGTVVGFSEICGIVFQIGQILPNSVTVCFRRDKFFNNTVYTYDLADGIAFRVRKLVFGAWLAAKFASSRDRIIYIGSEKLLIETLDYGAFEFKFMKNRGITIITWFTGSDIRSLDKLRELHRGSASENYADIIPLLNPEKATWEYEESQRKRALTAEYFSDFILNNERDQTSYLKTIHSDTFPITDASFFCSKLSKFNLEPNEQVIILHAPSSPVIKGTPLVRSVVKRLILEGHAINYIEARSLNREEMQRVLLKTHVVLNQFYSKIPGHFGFEAMASSCIVLQSAEIPIEKLKEFGLQAYPWIECSTYDIYDQLKKILNDLASYIPVAESGYSFARLFAHPNTVKEKLTALLDKES